MVRNNKRNERYKAIYDTFEPFRQAKKATIHSIMSYGKKHPLLKYPVLLGAVAFIFVYNVFLHFLIQMHVREKLARGFAFSLAVIMVITSVDVTAFAMKKADENEKKMLISQIMDLEDAILAQEIAVGDSVEKIVFPDYLEVLVQEEVEEEDTSVEIEETTEEILTEIEETMKELWQ